MTNLLIRTEQKKATDTPFAKIWLTLSIRINGFAYRSRWSYYNVSRAFHPPYQSYSILAIYRLNIHSLKLTYIYIHVCVYMCVLTSASHSYFKLLIFVNHLICFVFNIYMFTFIVMYIVFACDNQSAIQYFDCRKIS